MIVVDGRGFHGKQIAKKNLEKIKEWFCKNPESTITDCCKNTGLSYPTVKKHLSKIPEK